MKQPYLSIIIPCYNEEKNIHLGALDAVYGYLVTQSYPWEVIIVNDGSSDDSRKLIEKFASTVKGFRVIDNPHQGKAATVITGILASKGEYVLFSDLDQATPIREVEKLLPWFDRGYDVVIGSRSGRREGAPILRIMMARGFMFLRSLILGITKISDTQCGFKAFRNTVAREIFQKLSLYGKMKEVSGSMVTAGFDIEVLFLATKLGYKIKEIPVEWHYVETRRVNPVKDSWEGLRDIIAIRIRDYKRVYDIKDTKKS